jgi:hypothetical protein
MAVAIAVDDSDNVYVTGESFSSYGTIKYSSNGDLAWIQMYYGPGHGNNRASALVLDDAGNIYVTGRSYGEGTYFDYATIKYTQFLCGDANKDGMVDVGDVVYLMNYLFQNGPAPVPILKAGDAAFDGVIDVGDVVYLINYLFRNGPEPGR